MREREKYVLAYFPEYDHCGLCKFLEEKARRGWMYVGNTLLGMRFLPMAPRKRKFQIVYLPQNELLQVNLERLKDYCTLDGWVFIKENNGRCIFFNDRPDPIPIETDPVIQVASINKNMEATIKGYQSTIMMHFMLAVLNLGDALRGDITRLLLLVGQVMSCFVHGMLVINYRRWYEKASVAAEEYGTYTSTDMIHPKFYSGCLLFTLAISGLAFVSLLFDFWGLLGSVLHRMFGI